MKVATLRTCNRRSKNFEDGNEGRAGVVAEDEALQ